MNRKEAKEAGQNWYTSFKECLKCGSYDKYVSNYNCKPCKIEQGLKKLADKDLMAKYRTNEKKRNGLAKWRRENPEQYKKQQREYFERDKDIRMQRMYGLSLNHYNKILTEQNNSCAICGKNEMESCKSLAVDHCHDTNKIRGLLCNNCNLGIGNFQDSINLLQKALDYLHG